MLTFCISVVLLFVGYFIYGKYIERTFGPDDRQTPAVRINDGVDYVVMPSWKIFMIQFLNIAGTGPIFGAIMGIWFGTSAYLWIVLGCIFAGAVHDYIMGMLSLRLDGAGMPNIVGQYLGPLAKNVMLVFAILLLILVGAVFVLTPATLLAGMMPENLSNILLWVVVIFIYYVIATMMPVDKIIGKIYPLFAFSLIFMAVSLMVILVFKWPVLPELWDGVGNIGAERLGIKNAEPIFPALFITIACGAISGFHATQSPLMARCLKHEKQGRPIFYGAMITEGLVALIWASISSWFFYDQGWREVCTPETIAEFTGQTEKTVTQFFTAPKVVMNVCQSWLGTFGGVLAVLGVVAAPITSGDTALRSVRLIIAENLHINQRPILKRLMVSIPVFLVTIAILVWQMDNPDGFNTVWKYFGWANQTLGVFSLWTIAVYLTVNKKNYFIGLIPALFLTAVSVSFILGSPTAFNLSSEIAYIFAAVVDVILLAAFCMWRKNQNKTNI